MSFDRTSCAPILILSRLVLLVASVKVIAYLHKDVLKPLDAVFCLQQIRYVRYLG